MKKVFIILFLILLVAPYAKSTILFYSEPDETYNIGEPIFVNFSIEKDFSISDFVETFLICGNEKFIVSKNYLEVKQDEKSYFPIEFPAPISGDCNFSVSFDDEEAHTNKFEISNNIDIDYQLNDISFFPGDEISINGNAEKENGGSFEGLITVSINDLFEKSFESSEGDFSFNFSLPNDIPSGNYNLEISAFEKNWKDDVLNSGEKSIKIKIIPKPTGIFIDSDESVSPPINFSFRVSLLDQSEKLIDNDTILLKIFDPVNNLEFEKNIVSGEYTNYFFGDNSSKGEWRINAYYGNIFVSKSIFVDANKAVEVSVGNNKLLIKNSGNILYDGIVGFNISNGSFHEDVFVNVNIPVGETYEYDLNFVGIYNISFEGGESFSNVPLTGASIFTSTELTSSSYLIGFGIILFLLVFFFVRKSLLKILKKIFSKNKSSHSKSSKISRKLKSANYSKLQACMIFIKFDKLINLDDLFDSYGFSFKSVGDNIGYVLFYSSTKKNSEKKMFDFARALRRAAKHLETKVSIVINSTRFTGMSRVKDFASFNRELLSFSDGEILIPKNVFNKIDSSISPELKNFFLQGKDVEVYVF